MLLTVGAGLPKCFGNLFLILDFLAKPKYKIRCLILHALLICKEGLPLSELKQWMSGLGTVVEWRWEEVMRGQGGGENVLGL